MPFPVLKGSRKDHVARTLFYAQFQRCPMGLFRGEDLHRQVAPPVLCPASSFGKIIKGSTPPD